MTAKGWMGLLALVAVLIYLFMPVSLKLKKLKKQSEELEAEIQVLSTRVQLMQNELKLLKEDPVYIEHMARKTFHKARSGEMIYRFVPSEEVR